MHGNWLGFLELLIVFGFALGWGVLELVALRLDRKRTSGEGDAPPAADAAVAPEASSEDPSRHPER